MKTLGTILPTRASLATNDRWARQNTLAREKVAAGALSHLEHRQVGDETRFYSGEKEFSIVSRSLRVLWFERRADGEWYAKK